MIGPPRSSPESMSKYIKGKACGTCSGELLGQNILVYLPSGSTGSRVPGDDGDRTPQNWASHRRPLRAPGGNCRACAERQVTKAVDSGRQRPGMIPLDIKRPLHCICEWLPYTSAPDKTHARHRRMDCAEGNCEGRGRLNGEIRRSAPRERRSAQSLPVRAILARPRDACASTRPEQQKRSPQRCQE